MEKEGDVVLFTKWRGTVCRKRLYGVVTGLGDGAITVDVLNPDDAPPNHRKTFKELNPLGWGVSNDDQAYYVTGPEKYAVVPPEEWPPKVCSAMALRAMGVKGAK